MSDKRGRGWKEPQPCGKLGYRSERHALRALDALAQRAEQGDTTRHECRVYECRLCWCWHTTSNPSTDTARVR